MSVPAAKIPGCRTWGSTSAVDIDKDGRSIWVAERCGANSCLGSDLPVVLKFDAYSTLVTSFARGLMIFPHGIHVDRDGNIWVTDGRDNKPSRRRGAPADAPLPPAPARLMSHQVFKFSPDGKLLCRWVSRRRHRRRRILPAERRHHRHERRHLRCRRTRRAAKGEHTYMNVCVSCHPVGVRRAGLQGQVERRAAVDAV